MIYTVTFFGSRLIAYPFLILGIVLCYIAQVLIRIGAWLTDNEDVTKEIR